jgi:hypothetical protein
LAGEMMLWHIRKMLWHIEERWVVRGEALGVRKLLGAPTTMWVSVGASPTGPTSNGQLDIEDLKAGSTGEKLRAPSEPG